MEGLKVCVKDAPQDSSPAPGPSPLNQDQPPVAPPRQNPVEEAQEEEENEAKADDNNEPLTPEDNNVTVSVPSTTSEARFYDSETVKEEDASIKIIARLSLDDDDLVPSVSSPQTVNSSNVRSAEVAMISNQIDQSNNAPATPRKTPKTGRIPRTPKTPSAVGQVDTSSSLESVKAVVSKFGGIVDWKAHRLQTMERRKTIELELEKAQEEMPLFKKQSEEAEEAKYAVLKELDGIKKLIKELKLNLERAQTEEQQARQDSELAKLRVEELEKGLADEASAAAMAQLEVVQARHAAALTDFKAVEVELKQTRRDYDMLVAEKDAYEQKAEEALSISKKIEKTVEDLTIELITAKVSLESALAVHLEAEEDRIGAVMAIKQDMLNWEKELKQAEEELERMRQQVDLSKPLRSKLDSASELLQYLKAGLAAYMELKADQDSGYDVVKDTDKTTRVQIEATLAAAKKKLDQVKLNLEKKTDKVNILKAAATSLKSELEEEKAELSTLQQREGMASTAVASFEAELERTKSEILIIQLREKEYRERMVELPKKLQEAALEAEQAKSLSQRACEELRKAKEEAEQVKASKSTVESRLRAAQKEIEAAKASERLALKAINALQESESTQCNEDDFVTLSLEEYYELSKKAHEAEELAKNQVADALAEIELAKESELNTLKKLEEANRETAERKKALEAALQKAEKAKDGKLAVEQELHKWRADHEPKLKSGRSVSKAVSLERVEAKKSHSSMFKSAPLSEFNISDLTPDEFERSYLGLHKQKLKLPADAQQAPKLPTSDLPADFDWREHGAVGVVKDQGSCGSCWSFSTIGALEGAHYLATGELLSLSEQQLVDCDHECDPAERNSCDSGCNGGLMNNAFEYILKAGGVQLEKDYPYTGVDGTCKLNKNGIVAGVSNFSVVSLDDDQIAANLVKHGPLAVGINALWMQTYIGGVSCPYICGKTLNHGVVLVGYGAAGYAPIRLKDKPYWIIKNSWGESWGESGYYKICRGKNLCGVESMVSTVTAVHLNSQ